MPRLRHPLLVLGSCVLMITGAVVWTVLQTRPSTVSGVFTSPSPSQSVTTVAESSTDHSPAQTSQTTVPNTLRPTTPSVTAPDKSTPRTTKSVALPILSYAVAADERHITRKTAGTITSYTLRSLQPNRVYRIPLHNESFLGLDVQWNQGSVRYGLAQNDSVPRLTEVELFTEEEVRVPYLTSETLFPELPSTPKYLFVQVDSPNDTVTFNLINPSVKPLATNRIAATSQFNRNSGAKYTSLRMVSRDTWGADLAPPDIDDPSRQTWNPQYYRASRIVIHHTVTPNRPSNPELYVRSVYLSHANGRGWGDVGYNYLIDHLGNIYEGKFGGDETLGYHAFGAANTMSIGISLLGDFTSVMPSSAAQTSLKKLMAEKAALYGFTLRYGQASQTRWLNPNYTVFGHRDSFRWYSDTNQWGINATACPGNTFYTRLAGLTTEAEGYRATHFDPIKQVVAIVNADMTRAHEPGTLLVAFNVPPSTPENEVRALIPSFSGITATRVRGNSVVIKTEAHLDPDLLSQGISEWVVPPVGWSGYDSPNVTFFPASGGPEDRLRTLYKIFKLDPQVSSASLNFQYGL